MLQTHFPFHASFLLPLLQKYMLINIMYTNYTHRPLGSSKMSCLCNLTYDYVLAVLSSFFILTLFINTFTRYCFLGFPMHIL